MKRTVFIIVACLTLLTACNKGDDPGSGGGGGTENPPPAVPTPDAATLMLPVNSEACVTGTSPYAGQVMVTFSWRKAANTDEYSVAVSNIAKQSTGVYTNITDTTATMSLDKGQAYSWNVKSYSAKTSATSQSATWKFYIAGDAATHYAPYPATLVSPAANEIVSAGGAAQVSEMLKWEATDVDKDITSYAVYLDDKDASTNVVPSVATNTTTLQLAAGKTYYWRVVTKDATGNSSASDVSSFTVQ